MKTLIIDGVVYSPKFGGNCLDCALFKTCFGRMTSYCDDDGMNIYKENIKRTRILKLNNIFKNG